MRLATFKHISSKNANYGDAEKYLTFEHDEFTMKATLDENGRMIPRSGYRISTINCGDEDFSIACMRANLKYEKNQKREDVKSHHYIISFDPRDGIDNGLTVDRAQELGQNFCKEHFPGHQALVCTHPDGHNHSENIHVHIVINSLRIEDVPMLPHMDRPADRKAGCKHRCTDVAMNYFKSEVMEMCQNAGLYQIDLLHGSKERITEREYWAQRKGQASLNKENAILVSDGKPVKQTKYETDKSRLRKIIRSALSSATSFEEFSSLLLQEGVNVKESRGRLSYLTPERTKPITARKLGDDFDKSAVLAMFEKNALKTPIMILSETHLAKREGVSEFDGSVVKHDGVMKRDNIAKHDGVSKQDAITIRDTKAHAKGLAKREPLSNAKGVVKYDILGIVKGATNHRPLEILIDRDAKRAEGKGFAYDRWAGIFNLKQMSETLLAFNRYGFSSMDEVEDAVSTANADVEQALSSLKETEALIAKKKELLHHLLVLKETKPVIEEYKKIKSSKKRDEYREQHIGDFIRREASIHYFKESGEYSRKSAKKVNQEIQSLIQLKNEQYNDYRTKYAYKKEIFALNTNMQTMIRDGEAQSRNRKHQAHER